MEAKLRLSSISNEDLRVEDKEDLRFYEDIEAPKFVDLTLPERLSSTVNDGYWFCQRVGCDQKHEEEMNSEVIYRNFVLRVMAARSPNISLRKAISKRATSKNCPASAPPKPSKSRIPRLAVVPAFPGNKIELQKIVTPSSKTISTPKPRVKQVAAKYMTTPKGRRCSGNPKPFQSVRNPVRKRDEGPNIDRVVAKALLFNSPGNSGKAKASVNVSTPISMLCKKTKKLEITRTSQKKSNTRRVLKGVAANDLRVLSRKGAKSCRNLKGKTEDNADTPNQLMQDEDVADCHLSKTVRDCSTDACSASLKPETDDACGAETEEEETTVDTMRNNTWMDSLEEGAPSRDQNARSCTDAECQIEPSINSREKVSAANTISVSQRLNEDGQSYHATEKAEYADSYFSKDGRLLDQRNQGHQSHGKAADSESVAIADKESALASNIIRESNAIEQRPGKDAPGNHDRTMKVKVLKENRSTGDCNQEMKNKKSKVTNPKPFRLRTDERGILKEATLEKKLNLSETGTTWDLSSDNWQKEQFNKTQVKTNFSAYGRSGINAPGCIQARFTKHKVLHTGAMQHNDSKKKEETKSSLVNPKKPMVSGQPKPTDEIRDLMGRDVAHALKENTIEGSSVLQKEPIRSQGDMPTSSKLGGLSKGTEGKRRDGTFIPAGKASGMRRPLTIPKEPNFHASHLPKTCTKTLQAR